MIVKSFIELGEIFVKKLENHAKLGKKAAKRGKNVPKTAV